MNLFSDVNDGHGATAVEMSKMADFPKQLLKKLNMSVSSTLPRTRRLPEKERRLLVQKP